MSFEQHNKCFYEEIKKNSISKLGLEIRLGSDIENGAELYQRYKYKLDINAVADYSNICVVPVKSDKDAIADISDRDAVADI